MSKKYENLFLKAMKQAGKITEEQRETILEEVHPFIRESIELKGIEIQNILELSEITTDAYADCSFYLLGKVGYELLENHLIEHGDFTEDEIRRLVLKKYGFLRRMYFNMKALGSSVSEERSRRIYEYLECVSDIHASGILGNRLSMLLEMIQCGDIVSLASYGFCIEMAKNYYMFKDTSIEDFLNTVVIPNVWEMRREKIKVLK